MEIKNNGGLSLAQLRPSLASELGHLHLHQQLAAQIDPSSGDRHAREREHITRATCSSCSRPAWTPHYFFCLARRPVPPRPNIPCRLPCLSLSSLLSLFDPVRRDFNGAASLGPETSSNSPTLDSDSKNSRYRILNIN